MKNGMGAPRARARGRVRSRPGPARDLAPVWRRPEPADRPSVQAILEASGVFRADELEVALEVFDDYCDAPDEDYYGLAAADPAGPLIGFAFWGATPCTLGTWDLYWIAVDPGLQGRGLGRALLARVERRMVEAGARMALIETSSRTDYAATRQFYAACGYGEVARVSGYYDEGDDLVVFTKRFATRGR